MDVMKLKKGDRITLRDRHVYEVLTVYPGGYLVANDPELPQLRSDAYFFRHAFLQEMQRRGQIVSITAPVKEAV